MANKEYSEDEKFLLSHYINEWKMLSQYINDMDRGYINFFSIFVTVATAMVAILSLISESENKNATYIFYIIPLAYVAVFGYMGYQFRITAILRGHLARLEDTVNDILGEHVYLWNSSLVEVYMAHRNAPNNTLMIPALVFVVVTAIICFLQTLQVGFFWLNIIYWSVVIGLAMLVLIPFFFNGNIRKKTYQHDKVVEMYRVHLQMDEKTKQKDNCPCDLKEMQNIK